MDRRAKWSPDGEWVYFESNRSGQFSLWRVPFGGGEPEIFSRDLAWLTGDYVLIPQWSRDGSRMYFMGVSERAGNLWELTVEDGTIRALSDLQGKRGVLEPDALATDGDYMYFSWAENLGDIGVMDVAQ